LSNTTDDWASWMLSHANNTMNGPKCPWMDAEFLFLYS
jgi:hypothetical protein